MQQTSLLSFSLKSELTYSHVLSDKKGKSVTEKKHKLIVTVFPSKGLIHPAFVFFWNSPPSLRFPLSAALVLMMLCNPLKKPI